MSKFKYVIYAFFLLGGVGVLIVWSVVSGNKSENFSSGFESGVIDTSRWQLDKELSCEINIDDKKVRGGQYSIRFEAGPKSRCEIVPYVFSGVLGKYKREPYNESRWYSFSVFLDEPWELVEQNELIAQWHSTRDRFFFEKRGRGPPLALRIIGGYWYLTHGWDADFFSRSGSKASHKLWHDELIVGEWVDWEFHIRWSWKEDGLIEVWKNDELVLRHEGPNTYNDVRGTYLKLGSYHPGVDRTVYIDNVYIGERQPSEAMLNNAK